MQYSSSWKRTLLEKLSMNTERKGPTSGVDCTSSFAHSNNERGQDRGKESLDEAKEEEDELNK